jgi:hypothetical protein
MQQEEHPAIEEIRWIESIANLMDSKFTLPGTRFKFGLDPIIGLIPGIGDITSFAISGLLVTIMARHDASGKVVILMLLNILLDAIIGGIPIIGNLFDFVYKANNKNIRLLKNHYGKGKHQGSGKGIIIGLTVILLLLIGLMIYGFIKLFQYLIHYLF